MLSIRPATADDAALLSTLIRELAEYERELELVTISSDDLLRDGFGPEPKFRALIGDWNGEPAGYALFFGFYSTWEGRAGLFLEDLFVRSQFRGHGIGKALLAEVACIALKENCFALRWEVLDWNENAVRLYKSLGGEFRDQWRSVLLSGDHLTRLADKALSA